MCPPLLYRLYRVRKLQPNCIFFNQFFSLSQFNKLLSSEVDSFLSAAISRLEVPTTMSNTNAQWKRDQTRPPTAPCRTNMIALRSTVHPVYYIYSSHPQNDRRQLKLISSCGAIDVTCFNFATNGSYCPSINKEGDFADFFQFSVIFYIS